MLEGDEQFKFRSALGTLLFISQDRVDIQHAVRNLSQFMAKPTKRAELEVKHVILYLKRTENYGLLLPYSKFRSKKAEIVGQVEEDEEKDFLEVFSDSDWAGDKSSAAKRRHSVSSVFEYILFLSLPVPDAGGRWLALLPGSRCRCRMPVTVAGGWHRCPAAAAGAGAGGRWPVAVTVRCPAAAARAGAGDGGRCRSRWPVPVTGVRLSVSAGITVRWSGPPWQAAGAGGCAGGRHRCRWPGNAPLLSGRPAPVACGRCPSVCLCLLALSVCLSINQPCNQRYIYLSIYLSIYLI